MKKLCFLLLILISIPFDGFGHQVDGDNGKKEKMFREMREFKMKYLAQEMDLSENQKQRFFELYDEMSKNRDVCFKNVRELEKKLRKEGKNASEEDYQQVTEALNKANIESAEIEKSYNEKFAEFLTQKQIYKLKEAEKNFRERLEEMRHNRKKEKSKDHKK